MQTEQFHGTTILSVRRGNQVAMGGDGQVTLGNIVVKATATKVRKVYQDKILVGFAGSTADAFSLLDRFEAKLEKHQGNLQRSAVELAKDWRTDRMLRRLEAMLIVADVSNTYVVSGHRLRWRVRAGCGDRPAAKYGTCTRRHRQKVADDCSRPVHLHQSESRHRIAGLITSASGATENICQ